MAVEINTKCVGISRSDRDKIANTVEPDHKTGMGAAHGNIEVHMPDIRFISEDNASEYWNKNPRVNMSRYRGNKDAGVDSELSRR